MPAARTDAADGRIASPSPPADAIVSSLSATPSGALVWTASGGILRATADGLTTFLVRYGSSVAHAMAPLWLTL
jgi:hypothetical protein